MAVSSRGFCYYSPLTGRRVRYGGGCATRVSFRPKVPSTSRNIFSFRYCSGSTYSIYGFMYTLPSL